MGRMPGAKWLGEHGSRKMIRYDVVCVHTIVGYAPAHAAHFSVARDGVISQSRDTAYQSAANLEGNHRVIAIETADMPPAWPTYDGHAVPGFTDAQEKSVIEIIRWCNRTHGIPIVPCPDSRSSSRGVAYHRQGVDGNFLSAGYRYPGRVAGGEKWSSAYGKVCPGDRKIAVLLDRIIPFASGGPQPQEEDMKSKILASTSGPHAGAWWLTDGVTKRWINTVEHAAFLVFVGLAEWNNGSPWLVDWSAQLGPIPLDISDNLHTAGVAYAVGGTAAGSFPLLLNAIKAVPDQVASKIPAPPDPAVFEELTEQLAVLLAQNPELHPGLTEEDIPAVAAAVVLAHAEALKD